MKKKAIKILSVRKSSQMICLIKSDNNSYSLLKNLADWLVVLGLLGMVFSTGCISAQSQSDSLYNPFLIENSNFPYQPITCMIPRSALDRLRSDEAIEVIEKAFADSGIELEEKVWLGKENAGVYLNGYSEEDEIGFVFINRRNMDESFRKGNNVMTHKSQLGEKITLKEQVKRYEEIREGRFQAFLKQKNLSFTNISTSAASRRSAEIYQKYIDELNTLEAVESNRDEFYAAFLDYRIISLTKSLSQKDALIKDMLMYINTRFDTSVEKIILLQNAFDFRIPRALNVSVEFITADFEKLKEIKSDRKFIENFLILKSFIGLNHGMPAMRDSKEYQALKADIIHNYPLNKWFENTETLDSYYDKRFISLEEAKRIDEKNKSGKQFIALISIRHDLMIISQGTSFVYPQEKYDELRDLRKEYREKNALLPEVKEQRRVESEKIMEQYPSDKLRDSSSSERKATKKEIRAKLDALHVKYNAMERLTEEEKADYQSKIDEIRDFLNEWSKNSREEGKAQTICKLEEEVKMYIQWAKSQQGK